jgi:cytochrome c oxidase cbb3-type subunit 3
MMKRTIAVISAPLCLAVALGSIAPVGARRPAGRVRSEHGGQKNSALGRQVYMRNCAQCHGADAKGKNGPRLVGTSLSLDEIEQTVTDGRQPKMPSFSKQLSATEVKAVSAYVRSLGAGS